MSNSQFAQQQLAKLNQQISELAEFSRRDQQAITLLGASKKQTVDLISQFQAVGLNDFGENYLQEALKKQAQLKELPITWHFIGGIQSNKCKDIAENFSWVHAIDRLKIAERLNHFRSTEKPLLNVLIQLNVDTEKSKNGTDLTGALSLAEQIIALPNLRLRGLMVIPLARAGLEQQRQPFALAKKTLENINQQLDIRMDTLSMGMSNDIQAAIFEGSTMLRVGTALFGSRT